ncbi:MAG: sel1 repeat family protein, partial [Clostridia bacterium]|nr:sel1 repeat family protein [Clostridia bacterium]
MKCTHCEYTWTPADADEALTCPACGKAVQSKDGELAYKRAVVAEQESRLADAVRDYKYAAEEQVSCAAYGVFRCLTADKTQSKDREALFWLRVAAAFSDPIACYKLSRRFAKEEKAEKAAYYLRKAADEGYADACLKVAAVLKENGELGGARYYLEKIKHLSFKAKCKLLFIKAKAARPALTTPESEAYALLDLAKEAGAKGFAQIAYRLLCVAEPAPQVLYEKALRDLEGLGAARPFEAIEADLRKAGEGGYTDAFMTLSELFLSGSHFEQSNEKAFLYLKEAAKAGDVEAMLRTADSYNEGILCPVHKEKAIYWYEKAAKAGNPLAAEQVRSIGQLLSDSFAKAQNLQKMGEGEKAFALYKQLADIGHTPSACNVGMCYQKGIGVSQSYKNAAAWYEKAIEGGSAAGACNLGMLYGSNLG